MPVDKLPNQLKNEKISAGNRRSKKPIKRDFCNSPKFHIYSLRSLPLTAHHLIDNVKTILSGHTSVPFNLEVSQSDLQYMLQAYNKPLMDGGLPRRSCTKTNCMKNFLALLQGAELAKLRTYVLSSIFTLCYFLRKYHESDEQLNDAYMRIKNKIAPSRKQISRIAKLIVKPGDKVNFERIRGVCRNNCIELSQLLNTNQTIFDEVTEEDEACMKYYFRCYEVESAIEPEDEFVVFKNKDGAPLYVRGRELLTLTEFEAGEATRLQSEQHHEDDGKNHDSEKEVTDVGDTEYTFEVNNNVYNEDYFINSNKDYNDGYFEENCMEDNKDNFEDFYIENDKDNFDERHIENKGNFKENDFGNDKEAYIEDNKVEVYVNEPEVEIEIDENMILTSDRIPFQTRSSSALEISSITSYKSFDKHFNNERRSDVKFVFGDGKCIHAHSIILESKSDAFTDLFSNDVSVTSPGIINVKNVDYEVMYEVIRFIYTDKVQNLDIFASQLLEPAKTFILEDLKVICEDQLCKDMSIDNVIDLLMLAEDYDLSVLKKQAKQLVAANMKDIVILAKFENLIIHHPKIALDVVRYSAVK
ncbi:uncharacterized protein LOC131668585 isoform X2 [Phymastichus coffea]|nr:uncharacterized protein LOC131668585 isoform X2 [Phymastichus coffea]XP_058798859.1 uncharacterized protein LOC131668585 isoform X2 [Phymastichus coffea]